MIIEFYGDSFSFDSYGWPSMLADRLSHKILNHSISVSSITETISLLRTRDTLGDIVCITISSPDRIYHPDYLIHPTLTSKSHTLIPKKHTVEFSDEIETAIKYYFAYLENDTNRSVRYECQFNWLLSFTNKFPNTKFVLLPCFESTNIIVDNYNSIITNPKLIDIWLKNKRGVPDVNHMTLLQNKQLADQLYELLINYDSNKSKIKDIIFK